MILKLTDMFQYIFNDLLIVTNCFAARASWRHCGQVASELLFSNSESIVEQLLRE